MKGDGHTTAGSVALLLHQLFCTLSLGQFDLSAPIAEYPFKASHNSYEQPHSVTHQLDGYNVWCLELDLCGRNRLGLIEVRHNCFFPFKGHFVEYLDEIRSSKAWGDRVLFLWLDIKESCVLGCRWRLSDEDRIEQIATDLRSVFGEKHIFSKEDWARRGKRWPSIADLLADQKFVVSVYDNNDHNPNHPLLFVSAHKMSAVLKHTAFLNVKDANKSAFRGLSPEIEAQILWRAYDLNTRSEWQRAERLGMNLLATDNYDEKWTFSDRVFPPLPVYIRASAARPQHGTLRYPYSGITLSLAVNRLAIGSEIRMGPGHYPAPLLLNKPMTVLLVSPEEWSEHTNTAAVIGSR